MSAQDYDKGKVSLTLTTSDACNIAGFGRKHAEKVYEFYKTQARNFVGWKQTFDDTQWEVPGWSCPIENVAVFFARALAIELDCVATKTPLANLVNEERVVATAGRLALPYDYPFYVVGKKMMEAALQTKPIDEWDFQAFPLPFPCMTFLLPKGTRFENEPMSHIVVFQWSKDPEETVQRSTVFIGGNGAFLPFLGVHRTDENGKLPVATAARSTETCSAEKSEAVALSIMQLALNLVGIMYARKELVEDDRVLRVVGKRQTVVKRPRMVGSSYTYKTVSAKSEPTGRSVTSHWRKAHWHTVSYGPGHSLKRLDWFEPVFVSSKI
jgi:hypothetical protein